jgi:hypothetical protein
VFVLALALALLQPLFMGADWFTWIYRALVLHARLGGLGPDGCGAMVFLQLAQPVPSTLMSMNCSFESVGTLRKMIISGSESAITLIMKASTVPSAWPLASHEQKGSRVLAGELQRAARQGQCSHLHLCHWRRRRGKRMHILLMAKACAGKQTGAGVTARVR